MAQLDVRELMHQIRAAARQCMRWIEHDGILIVILESHG